MNKEGSGIYYCNACGAENEKETDNQIALLKIHKYMKEKIVGNYAPSTQERKMTTLWQVIEWLQQEDENDCSNLPLMANKGNE